MYVWVACYYIQVGRQKLALYFHYCKGVLHGVGNVYRASVSWSGSGYIHKPSTQQLLTSREQVYMIMVRNGVKTNTYRFQTKQTPFSRTRTGTNTSEPQVCRDFLSTPNAQPSRETRLQEWERRSEGQQNVFADRAILHSPNIKAGEEMLVPNITNNVVIFT